MVVPMKLLVIMMKQQQMMMEAVLMQKMDLTAKEIVSSTLLGLP